MSNSLVNFRQKNFVRNYVRCGNAAKAARDAGYALKSARVTACRLLTKANIQSEIVAEKRRYEVAMGTDRDAVVSDLLAASDLAKLKADPAKMIAAMREISRVCGYVDG